MNDYDRLNIAQYHRWHLIPQRGEWHVMQEHEPTRCLIVIARHDDLRTALDLAEENGDWKLAQTLEQMATAQKPQFTAEFTMNPGEEPAISPDPNVAFLQMTAATHEGLTDEARRLIHQAAEAQRCKEN